MKINDLKTVLSIRFSYDILDFETLIKWENIKDDINFYRKYGDREINTIMPLDKDIIGYHLLIKLK